MNCRSSTLKVNYRTSHQIRRAADRLLPKSVRDVDGLEDERAGTISVFDGPEPEIVLAVDAADEQERVAEVLPGAVEAGTRPEEIGIFVRSSAELPRARAAARGAGLAVRSMVDSGEAEGSTILVGIMHLAKGLEFRMVVLMACDEDVLPLAERVEQVADAFELDAGDGTAAALCRCHPCPGQARDLGCGSGVGIARRLVSGLLTVQVKRNSDV